MSILNDTKKILGIGVDYTAFDEDILMHINSAFSTLNQLGVGPRDGFQISDETATWDTFVVDSRLNPVKTYIYLRVRLLFDPPGTSYHIEAMTRQIKELEWRLNVIREEVIYDDPSTVEDESLAGYETL